jgi:UDP-4-amino-4-deoxy-L-arabinose formyltransferase/UDP-glucuronic acid dehydrogenase (UDP-4-keto-hexauronic acid decarboxylating)
VRFAALGRTRIFLDAVLACAGAGHEPVLVGTCAASPEYGVGESDFQRLAERFGCPFFADADANRPEILDLAAHARADVAISMNWLTMIGPDLRSRFAHGVINAHAGDLPRYRGNAVPNWAILNAEREVVLTLHLMSDELDAGPVLLKQGFPLTDDTYIGDVYEFLAAAVPDAFVRALDGLEQGTLRAQSQPDDPALALRCHPRRPEDGLLDWRQPAETLARLVRASAEPFGGAFTHLNGRRLTVWRARASTPATAVVGVPGQVIAIDRSAGTIEVLTGHGTLVVAEVEADGVRGPAGEAVSSLRTRLGLNAQLELERIAERLAALEAELGAQRT